MTLSAIGTQWCTYPPRTRISRLAGCILPRGVLYGMNHCGQRPRRLGRKVRSASVARESRYGASEFGSPRRLPAGRVCFDIHQAGRRRGWHQTPRSRSVTRTCQQSGWARGHLTNTSPSADPESKKGRRLPALRIFGGRYWDRTSDPCRVKRKLAQAATCGFPHTFEFTAILDSHACRCFPWPARYVAPLLHHFADSALAFPFRTGQHSRVVQSETPAPGRKARFPRRLLATALPHLAGDWTAVGVPAPKVGRPSQMKIEYAAGAERLHGGTSDRRGARTRPRIHSPRPLGPAVRHRHRFRTTTMRPYHRHPGHRGPRTPLRRGFEAHLATACSCRALQHSTWAP